MQQIAYLNIARYFVLVECFECRLALLTGEKALGNFYDSVFEYVLQTLAGRTPGEKAESAMWSYGFEYQRRFYKAFFTRFPNPAAVKRMEKSERFCIDRLGPDSLKSIQKMYRDLVGLGIAECALGRYIENKTGREANIPGPILLPEIEDHLTLLLPEIVTGMNTFIELANIAQKIDKPAAKKPADHFPHRAVTSLAIFASHIGRTVCLTYGNKPDEAAEEMRGAVKYLKRCAMDINKINIDYIRSHADIFEKKFNLPGEYWERALQARILEHDRATIEKRVEAYQELQPYYQNLISEAI